jgi:hypothetical protein
MLEKTPLIPKTGKRTLPPPHPTKSRLESMSRSSVDRRLSLGSRKGQLMESRLNFQHLKVDVRNLKSSDVRQNVGEHDDRLDEVNVELEGFKAELMQFSDRIH